MNLDSIVSSPQGFTQDNYTWISLLFFLFLFCFVFFFHVICLYVFAIFSFFFFYLLCVFINKFCSKVLCIYFWTVSLGYWYTAVALRSVCHRFSEVLPKHMGIFERLIRMWHFGRTALAESNILYMVCF